MSRDTDECDSKYDVMISYSHADSKAVAEELYEELTAYGLDVWHDSVNLNIGDDILSTINQGLNESNHAVIVISPSYFEGMSEMELGGLVQIHNDSDHNVLLPVLHEMSFEELKEENPTLAGIIGTEISKENVDEVTSELYTTIQASGENTTSLSDGNDGMSRIDIDVSLQDFADISKGTEVTVNEWRTEGTPHDRGVRAVEMTIEESGLTYNASNFIGTSRVVTEKPLTGFVSNISEKSSGSTKFTLRIPQSRLDELSDDPSDYKSGFVS